jgi:hypothetical protein
VLAQAAALVRDMGNQSADIEHRLKATQLSVDVLQEDLDRVRRVAKLGDGRAMLVLARNWAALGSLYDELGNEGERRRAFEAALRLAGEARGNAPSAESYDLLLRLTDQASLTGDGRSDESVMEPLGRISPVLHECIKNFRDWLKSRRIPRLEEVRVALWCLQREWQSEGSLSRFAKGHAFRVA